MKILMICSKAFYDKLLYFKAELEKLGHEVFMPNCWDCPETEAKYRNTSEDSAWKAKMIKHSEEVISGVDAVLVLNYDKNGQKISIHYLQSKSGKVFNTKIKKGWSN